MIDPTEQPDNDLEARIHALILQQTDIRRPFCDTDELLDDLGLDGDDAVEFFDAYAETFSVDLTPLHARWRDHFGPEGFPLSFGLGMVLVGTTVSVPLILMGLPEWLVFALGMTAAFGWLIGLRAWPLARGPRLVPITVSDLIHAARIGRWPDQDSPS